MERKIVHINIADFGVAVERLQDSSLRKQPLILASPSSRALVYDMSEEAYQDGVRKGMRLGPARQRCRQAKILAPRPEQYHTVMQSCLRHGLAYTPLVEQAPGNGHLYLDVTGTSRLFGPAEDIGWRLRKIIRREIGIYPIWSVASSRLVAKVASRLVKPVGEYVVTTGNEASFLAPLPLSLLPGIYYADLAKLRELNITRMTEVAALSLQDLSMICGRRSRFVYQAVRGLDASPVQPFTEITTPFLFHHYFAVDSNEESVIRAALYDLVQQAGHALRLRNRGCRTVTVQLQYTDGVTQTRQAADKTVITDDRTLGQLATTALYRCWQRRVRLRKISLSCSRLTIPARQLSLFTEENVKREKNSQISLSLDVIHASFGAVAIQRAAQIPSSHSSLRNSPGLQ